MLPSSGQQQLSSSALWSVDPLGFSRVSELLPVFINFLIGRQGCGKTSTYWNESEATFNMKKALKPLRGAHSPTGSCSNHSFRPTFQQQLTCVPGGRTIPAHTCVLESRWDVGVFGSFTCSWTGLIEVTPAGPRSFCWRCKNVTIKA